MKEIITIRASSLSDLMDCPARWAAKHIDKKWMPTSGAAQLGTAVHAGAEVFDKAILAGSPISPNDAAGAVVDAINKPEEEVDWGKQSPSDFERIALSLHSKYCSEIAPTQIYTGIEVTCKRLEISDLGIALTGTTDRIRQTADGLGVADLKTGKTAVGSDGIAATGKHALQIGVYELLAEHSTGQQITAPGQIIGMNTANTPAAQRVGTGEVRNAKSLLIGSEGSPGALEIASKIIHSGMFYGNARSQLCSPKFCPIYGACKWKG